MKRFNFFQTEGGEIVAIEQPNGNYVLYEEAERLEKEHKELELSLKTILGIKEENNKRRTPHDDVYYGTNK